MEYLSMERGTLGNFAYMKIGVANARRDCVKKEDILNTYSWNEIKKFIQAKRKKFGVKV